MRILKKTRNRNIRNFSLHSRQREVERSERDGKRHLRQRVGEMPLFSMVQSLVDYLGRVRKVVDLDLPLNSVRNPNTFCIRNRVCVHLMCLC